MKKYEFTDEVKEINGHILHRIRRIEDGKIGGWVENEQNLAQDGDCWVYDDACVYEKAVVCGNAKLKDHAQLRGSASIARYAQVCGNAIVEGDAVIRDMARVEGNAVIRGHLSDSVLVKGNAVIEAPVMVAGNARVLGNAMLANTSDYIAVGPIYLAGSCNDVVTAYITADGGVEISSDYYNGSIDGFVDAIHAAPKYDVLEMFSKQYLAIAELVKIRYNIV